MNLKVCSANEAINITNEKPNYWHVISISTTEDRWPNLPNAAFVKKFSFYDIDKAYKLIDDTIIEPVSPNMVSELIDTGRSIGDNPLLVHCFAGISRSTATALVILLDKFYGSEFDVDLAVETVYKVREHMYPNKHVLSLGIKEIATRNNNEEYEILTWRKLYANETWKKILGV